MMNISRVLVSKVTSYLCILKNIWINILPFAQVPCCGASIARRYKNVPPLLDFDF